MKIGFVFSGQGAQYIGMGKELYENIPVCREIFDIGNEVLDFNIKELIFNGNKEELDITENTQPSILITSIAAMKAIEEKGIKAEVVAGLSLGEYSALVSSGALEYREAVALVRKRGKFMQEAVPLGIGAMVAIMGLSLEKINEALDKSRDLGIVEVANFNTSNQIVIGGEKEAVYKAKDLCLELGAKRAIELKVSGPFHTSLLEKASINLKSELDKIEIKEFDKKIISNVTGDFINSSNNVKDLLYKQVKSSVKWNETINKMIDYGIDTFIELGPGRVLSSFIKEISRERKVKVNIFNVEDIKSLNKTLEGIESLNA